MYVRDDLTCELVTAHSNMACDTLIVKVKTLNTLVIVNYRPPDSNEEEFEELLEVCQEAINKVTEKDPKVNDIFQIGDYNFKCITWPSKKIYSKEVENKATDKVQAKNLLKYAERNFLENCITTPTRGANTLDLCFTNNHNLINFYTTIVNTKFSDHNTLEMDLNFSYNLDKKAEKKTNPYQTKVPEYDTENADDDDWLNFAKMLDKVDIKTEFGGPQNTHTKTVKFYNLLEATTALIFKKKKAFEDDEETETTPNNAGPNNKIPKKIRQLMKRKGKLSKQTLSTSWSKNYLRMKEIEEIEEELENSYKENRIKQENMAIKKLMKNPNFFYSYQRKFSKTNERMSGFITKDGEIISDPFEQSEMLRKQYQSVYSQPNEESVVGSDFFTRCENCESKIVHECPEDVWNYPEVEEQQKEPCSHFTVPKESKSVEEGQFVKSECSQCKLETIQELRPDDLHNPHFDYVDFSVALDSLSSKAAPGPDGIPAKMLKKGKNTICHILNDIFKTSFYQGEIPAILKKAFVVPIYKSGSKAQPSNYRPVSLTSHLVKSFERVLVRALVAYLNVKGLMDKSQHGSRSGRSTLSQLLLHHDKLLEALENGDNIDAIYLDFAKAFDKVDHNLLLRKLKQMGVKGRLGMWIQNFLKNRTQQVLVDGKLSSSFTLISGIPQGSVLGPILFLIFISDITKDLSSDVFIYVDDTKIIKRIKNVEDVLELQEDLFKLHHWGQQNRMVYNGDKFVAIRHGKNSQIKEDTNYFSGEMEEVIGEEESTRDLGVIMQNDGSFSLQIEKAGTKARRKAGWINRTFYCKQGWFMRHMWNTLVSPHLDYCSQLWAPGEGQQLQKLEKILKDFT